MEEEIFTYHVNMPTTIRSFVVSNNDMSFTIMINARLGSDQQLAAYMHEIYHIKKGDYDKHCSADLIELFAHEDSLNSKCMGKVVGTL